MLTANWAYISLPRLQLEKWLSTEVEVGNEAGNTAWVAICPERLVVMQLCDNARLQGVEPGMSLSDAWLMAHELRYIEYETDLEYEHLQELAVELYQGFANIALDQEQCGIWIGLQKLQLMYADLEQVTEKLEPVLAPFTYQLTFSRTARGAQLSINDTATPLEQATENIAVQNTHLSPPLKDKLIRMGFVTVASLLQPAVSTLGKKLGLELVNFIAELKGQRRMPLAYYQPSVGFYHYLQLNSEVSAWGALRFPCNHALQVLEHYLLHRQLATASIQVSFFFRQHSPLTLVLRLARPAYKAADFLSVLQLTMEQTRLSAPVIELAVAADTFEPIPAKTASLDKAAADEEQLALVINRLQARLGEENVYGLVCNDHWLPDYSQQIAAPGTPPGQCQHSDMGWRPPWLTGAVSVTMDYWTIVSQPQRLLTPWWLQEQAQRDYVLARDSQGAWGWLYYEAQSGDVSGEWYLQGWAS